MCVLQAAARTPAASQPVPPTPPLRMAAHVVLRPIEDWLCARALRPRRPRRALRAETAAAAFGRQEAKTVMLFVRGVSIQSRDGVRAGLGQRSARGQCQYQTRPSPAACVGGTKRGGRLQAFTNRQQGGCEFSIGCRLDCHASPVSTDGWGCTRQFVSPRPALPPRPAARARHGVAASKPAFHGDAVYTM